VPQGKSTGSFEAVSIPAGIAHEVITEVVAPALIGKSFPTQKEFDTCLMELDGTPQKEKLGANTILACSIAFARLSADEKNISLSDYLRSQYTGKIGEGVPYLFMNMINGGAHATNNLAIQEYMLALKANTIAEAYSLGVSVYEALGKKLGDVGIGDEGGYMPDFDDDSAPLRLYTEVLDEMGVTIPFAIDAAGNEIDRSNEELHALYVAMAKEFPLMYLEDPFREDQFDAFQKLQAVLPDTIVAGDDLTVTNIERSKTAKNNESVRGMIIKPNQIGSVSETLGMIAKAREWDWFVAVSHRSGETDDTFIADLAHAVGADAFKCGAPKQKERVVKYERLIELFK